MEKDHLFNYRQPLVTAAGIILGFVLSFATDLLKQETKGGLFSLFVLLSTLVGITLLIISLYRILNNAYDRTKADQYYKRTLNYFIYGVVFSFTGALLKMIHTLFIG